MGSRGVLHKKQFNVLLEHILPLSASFDIYTNGLFLHKKYDKFFVEKNLFVCYHITGKNSDVYDYSYVRPLIVINDVNDLDLLYYWSQKQFLYFEFSRTKKWSISEKYFEKFIEIYSSGNICYQHSNSKSEEAFRHKILSCKNSNDFNKLLNLIVLMEKLECFKAYKENVVKLY